MSLLTPIEILRPVVVQFGAMATGAHAIRRLLDNNLRDFSGDEILSLYQNAC